MKGKAVVSIALGAAVLLVGAGPLWAGGSIRGTAVLSGEAPEVEAVNFTTDPQCVLMHGDHPPAAENIVVNPNGTLKWVLARIVDEMDEEYTAPDETVVMDQVGCVYQPHVSAVMVGQNVEFRNSDEVLHNVRSVSEENPGFNLAQPFKGMTNTESFEEPEVGIELKCDVHPWMRAYVHVIEHPFFAVTGDDGSFTIADVPAGTYELEVWQEELGSQTEMVTVEDGQESTVEFVFEEE